MTRNRWFYILLALAVLLALGLYAQASAQDCATAQTDEGEFSVCYATFTPEPTATATEPAPTNTATAEPSATATNTAQPTATATAAQPTNTPATGGAVRIAILGDSFYDEYQGTDNRGGSYHAVTFNGVELMQRLGRFDLGAWGAWGGSRRTGYEYNWAVSGAKSDGIAGQANLAAPQFRAGNVDYAFVGIGANDFSPYSGPDYAAIYNGTLAGVALQAKISTAIANVTSAVDTLMDAGAQGVAVTLFTDWNLDPITQRNYPDATKRARVGNAIAAVNAGIRSMAQARGAYVVDQNAFGATLLPGLDSQGRLNVGGELISFTSNGDEPHHAKLADGQHLGTVISGITANYYFVDALASFGVQIASLTDAEILGAAGIRAGPTATPTRTPTRTPAPPTATATVAPPNTPTPVTGGTPQAGAPAVNVPLLDVLAGAPELDANNRAIIWAGAMSPSGGYTQVRLVGRADGLSIYAQQMVPTLAGGQFALSVNGRNYAVGARNAPGWTLANRCTGDDCRGWNALRVIPWSELGGRPAEGDEWPLSLTAPNGEWAGTLHWGYPDYAGRNVAGAQVLTLPLSADATVGGSTDCGSVAYPDYFPTWGSLNWGASPYVNVQAQWDVADWPCYSRYFAQWSLAHLPAGAQVISATVTLRQFGNPGYGDGYASDGTGDTLFQAFEVVQPWTELGITWDNAPIPDENISRTLVRPIDVTCAGGGSYCNPGIPYSFDVTEIVRRAQAGGRNWASMALYTAAGQYHSGKYFSSREGAEPPVVRIAYTTGGQQEPTWTPTAQPPTSTPTPTMSEATRTATITPSLPSSTPSPTISATEATQQPPPTSSPSAPTTAPTATPTSAPSAGCTRTVSPGGLAAAVAALRPGDTLCLRDGTYTEAIAPRTNGTQAAPITIRAEHDGRATIDGQGVRKPLNLGDGTGGGSYFVIDGLVLRNGPEHVAIVKAANNVLRRVSVYDANTQVNSQALLIWGTGNTIESCIVAGSSRFAVDLFGGGGANPIGNNTVRQCFVMWEEWQGKNFCGIHWPGVFALGVYNSSQNRLESNIVYGKTVTNLIVQANSSDASASNNQVLGNISLLAGKDYDGSLWHYGSPTWPNVTRPQPTSNPYGGANCDTNVIDWSWPGQRIGSQLFGQGVLSSNVFRDNLIGGAAGLGFGVHNPGGGRYSGNVFDRFTLVGNGSDTASVDGGKGAQVQPAMRSNLTNSCISPAPSGFTQGAGADVRYVYKDGVKTSTPLLPWPMEQRGRDELGISITAIAQEWIDKAEAACN